MVKARNKVTGEVYNLSDADAKKLSEDKNLVKKYQLEQLAKSPKKEEPTKKEK